MSIVIDRNLARRSPEPAPSEQRPPGACEATQPAPRRSFRSLSLSPLKAAWRLFKPIREPLVVRFDRHVAGVLHADLSVLSAQFAQFAAQTAEAQQQSLAAMRETNIFVDGLVREIAQLQEQVQTLSQTCAQLSPAAGRFAARADGEGETPAVSAAGPNRLDRQRTQT
ncbi:MAG TPA: hypothetical protein VMV10_17490 [Pirellulales bacterium]|nr:hypothetical protein [Pirellulales bacterium]